MFPSILSSPPAEGGHDRTPARDPRPAFPRFSGHTVPLSADARPENAAMLATLTARHVEFLDFARTVGNHSLATIRWYRDGFRNYEKFLRLGLSLPPDEFQLRIYDVYAWLRWNTVERKLKPISMNGYWRSVKMFWNDVAARDGAQHPFEGKKQPPLPDRVPKAHAPEECRRILIAARNYPWESAFNRARSMALIGCALLAGLRRGEILRLEVLDVDLTDGTILVRGGKGRGGGKDRVAYIPDDLRLYLREYESARARAGIICPEYFASIPRKQGIGLDTIRRTVRAVRAASGVKFTVHTLRHSYVSSLIRSGVSLPVVSELAGHTKIETTMNYVRVFDVDKREAVKKLRLAV